MGVGEEYLGALCLGVLRPSGQERRTSVQVEKGPTTRRGPGPGFVPKVLLRNPHKVLYPYVLGPGSRGGEPDLTEDGDDPRVSSVGGRNALEKDPPLQPQLTTTYSTRSCVDE